MSFLSKLYNFKGKKANIWYAAKLRDNNWVLVRAEYFSGNEIPNWKLICDKGIFNICGLLDGNNLEKQVAADSLKLGIVDELKHFFIGKQIWFDRDEAKRITTGTKFSTDVVIDLVALT